VLRTDDGGKTWTNRVADIEDELSLGEWGWKIFFLDDHVGFVSLENFCEGAILKTTDGGHTWKRFAINDAQKNANLEGLGFADQNHGWVGGWGSADFLKGSSSETTDGGQNWSDIDWGSAGAGEFINRFRFFGNPVKVGYASGDTVYKYSAEEAPAAQALAAKSTIFVNPEPSQSARPIRLPITVFSGTTRLSINAWDRFGDHVRRISDETHPAAGERVVEWDLANDAGEPLEPGYYIVRVSTDDRSESKIVWVTD